MPDLPTASRTAAHPTATAPLLPAAVGLPVVLVPAALPDAGFVSEAQRAACAASAAFGALIGRARMIRESNVEASVPASVGHEHWLAAEAGLAEGEAVAAASAWADGADGAAWRLDPVHLHVGRDHLVLTDPALLALQAAEASELAATIAPLLAEEGLELVMPQATRWYLRETDPQRRLRLSTRSLLAAVGRSIDAYLPRGADDRKWKRLQNEVQMAWFDHPVNRQREARGEPPVNSLWLEGRCPGRSAACERLGRLAAQGPGSMHEVIRSDAPDGSWLLAARLLAAQIAGDPADWVAGWQSLDRTLFAEVAAFRGEFAQGARLVLAGESGWREWLIQPSDRWRIWRRNPPAARLAALEATPV